MRQVIRRKEVGDLRALLSRHRAAALTGGFGTGRRSIAGTRIRVGWAGHQGDSNRLDEGTPFSGIGGLLAAVNASANGASDQADLTTDEIVPSMMEALRSISGDEDTLILVPNADEMDMDSQRVLGQALRRLKSGRLHIVITARSIDDDGRSPVPESNLWIQHLRAHRLAVTPALTRFDTRESLAQFGSPPTPHRGSLAVSHIQEMAPT